MKKLYLFVFFLLHCQNDPQQSGMNGLFFIPCPDSPNCVSSMEANKKKKVDPLAYRGNAEQAMQKLLGILQKYPDCKIIRQNNNYIHAVFTTRIMKFQDDVEFSLAPAESVIHIKSASRSGYYDFSANKNRVERIRGDFQN